MDLNAKVKGELLPSCPGLIPQLPTLSVPVHTRGAVAGSAAALKAHLCLSSLAVQPLMCKPLKVSKFEEQRRIKVQSCHLRPPSLLTCGCSDITPFRPRSAPWGSSCMSHRSRPPRASPNDWFVCRGQGLWPSLAILKVFPSCSKGRFGTQSPACLPRETEAEGTGCRGKCIPRTARLEASSEQ